MFAVDTKTPMLRVNGLYLAIPAALGVVVDMQKHGDMLVFRTDLGHAAIASTVAANPQVDLPADCEPA